MPAIYVPCAAFRRSHGSKAACRSNCSSRSRPEEGTTTRSVCLMLEMEAWGTSWTEYGLVTGLPSNEAEVTRKRGVGDSPCNTLQRKPALWNTSIGPSAVEA